MKSIVKRGILGIANHSRGVRKLAHYVARHADTDMYLRLRERFIENGQGNAVDREARQKLVAKFERIDCDVPIGTTATDGLFIAEMLLSMRADGEIVECGCYAGGSTAKISLVARLLGRKLLVFDSFEGLPAVEEYYLRDHHCRRSDGWGIDWLEGRYAGRIDEVQANVEKYGDISVCSFIKGWFNESLTPKNLPKEIALAFADVDLANSARDCFTAMWPVISEGGVYVTHDAAYIKVLQEIYDPSLWRDTFGSIPPVLFGAGYGLCNESPHLGYMVKGESLSAEYLKSLTIEK